MSKVIKAAQLRVLVTDDSDVIIPSNNSEPQLQKKEYHGTVLEATNLIQEAREEANSIRQQAEQEAAEILENAKAQAEALLAEANEELETITLQAKEQGWTQGFDEGLAEGSARGLAEAELKAKELLENLDRLVKGAVQQRTNALAQLEHDFLKMSVIIAEKIIRKKLSEGDISWLEPTIQECMANLSLADRVTIRLHPKAYEAMLEAGIKFNDFRTNITWEPDEAVEFGGCIFETEAGRIDACLETRLNSVKNALEEAVYHG